LLPYLSPRSPGVALKLDLSDLPSSPDALLPGDPCGPYSTMRGGQIVLDNQGVMADIMVLCQADIYLKNASELNPISNLDVESAWQKAWGKIQKAPGGIRAPDGATVLPSQLDDHGALIPLKPLFYCRHVDRYGHPLCPFCGGDLVLCRDDDDLQKAGLPAYSSSLQRFLYCPDCHQASQEAPFYQHSLTAETPTRVQGCQALIEDFSRLLAKAELVNYLPCIGCAEAANCYGTETLALKRMAAVQFYPFHMLLQNAPTLNALDFLPLLAGAPRKEIEQSLTHSLKGSRLRHFVSAGAGFSTGSGFLFAGQARFFLEVLYLKLSFIEEVLKLVMAGATEPVNRMSMEGLGVHLAGRKAQLPYFWNFALKLIDPVGQPVGHAAESVASQSLAREFLGLTWFYVLVVNAEQPMETVHAAIDKLRAAAPNGQDAPQIPADPVLAPGNIFWHPGLLEPQTQWSALWQEALGLGLQLLQPDLIAGGSDRLQEIEDLLVDLKARVHANLFQAPSDSRPGQEANHHSADGQIVQILTSLLERWQPPTPPQKKAVYADMQSGPKAPPGVQPNEDGDYEETIILAAQSGADVEPEEPSTPPDLEKTVVIADPAQHAPLDAGTETEKTVVISAQPPPPIRSDVEKTVVIKAPERPADLDKTVVLASPSRPGSTEELDKTVVIGGPPAQPGDDDLEKTVVQKPDSHRTPPVPAPGRSAASEKDHSQPDGADDLDATVVIPPKSGKNRKPKP